ncbi:unnamed protein product [Gordionus sp. m RMFG-2023]
MVIPYHCILWQTSVNSKGRHSLHCKLYRGRFIRHSKYNDTIARVLKSAGIPLALEPTGLYNSDGKRFDGSTMIPWKRGEFPNLEILMYQSSCPFQYTPRQIISLNSPSLPANYTFLPLMATTLASLGSHAPTFKELVKRISARIEDANEGFYIRQSLALIITKCNYLSFILSMTETP